MQNTFCYLWESKVFNGMVYLGLFLPWHLDCASCRIVAEEQNLPFILALDVLRGGRGGYVKGAVLDIAKIKYLLGGKFLLPAPQFSGLLFPPSRWQSLLGCVVLEAEITRWTVCPWAFEVQVAMTRFPRSSSLLQNRFCTQLRLSPRLEQEKTTLNSSFLDI